MHSNETKAIAHLISKNVESLFLRASAYHDDIIREIICELRCLFVNNQRKIEGFFICF